MFYGLDTNITSASGVMKVINKAHANFIATIAQIHKPKRKLSPKDITDIQVSVWESECKNYR